MPAAPPADVLAGIYGENAPLTEALKLRPRGGGVEADARGCIVEKRLDDEPLPTYRLMLTMRAADTPAWFDVGATVKTTGSVNYTVARCWKLESGIVQAELSR